MKDEIEILAANIISQARLPGAGVAGYAASVGGASALGGAIPTPTSFRAANGLPVRVFIPGRSPLYFEGQTEIFIIGDAQ